MFDIITFGSATKDIFLRAKKNVIVSGEEFETGEGVCFSLGSKIKVEDIYFTSGGGGTNTATTFAKQGFSVAYCGKLGEDTAGDGVVKDLDHYGIDRSLLLRTKEKPTNHSVVIDVPEKDRTILTYKGASDLQRKEDVDFTNLSAKWFYFAPFSSRSQEFFYELIDYVFSKEAKVMINPGKVQLEDKRTKEILRKADVVLLNMEEASILTGVEMEDEKEILQAVSEYGKSVSLVTKGVEGVVAQSKGKRYTAKPTYPDAVDKTGAGDAFGSGFLSEFIRSEDVKKSIQLGIANATSCLQKKGAKHGLLEKNQSFHVSPVKEIAES